ncbi:hypothetical protein GQ57_00025 [Burkholderia sp. MSh2]|nr:hypothetical protein GQ57_00025 [Burkholderia sp. MSh2]
MGMELRTTMIRASVNARVTIGEAIRATVAAAMRQSAATTWGCARAGFPEGGDAAADGVGACRWAWHAAGKVCRRGDRDDRCACRQSRGSPADLAARSAMRQADERVRQRRPDTRPTLSV